MRRFVLFPLMISTAAVALAQNAPEQAEQTREVGKAAAYAERWSDHAPLTVTFTY